VVGIEVKDHLVEWGRANVEKADGDLLSSGVLKLVKADGWTGWPEGAPYDAIHVGAAAESA
jgi:protein-L-isoaspartate(D-aspartate) O-methyltransferase